MKFTEELRSFLDMRLAAISVTLCVVGLATAHWKGVEAASNLPHEWASPSIAYDVTFAHAAWIIIFVAVVVTATVVFATGGKTYQSRRLAAQLTIATVAFMLLNLVRLIIRTAGH